MRKAHNRLDINVEYVVSEYTKGRTAQSIAEEIGVSKKSVLTRLREQNVERRKQSTYPEVTKEVLTELYANQKLSTRNIASIYGCSNHLICKRLSQFGINTRLNAGDPSFTEEERKAKYGMIREEHPRWKGGVTGINETLRYATNDWRMDVLHRQKFTCYVSGIKACDMHVHHITPFHELRDRLVEELDIELLPTIADYEEGVVEKMRDKIIELHANEDGYVMTKGLHRLFHNIYGYKTTISNIEEFKQRYLLGEFAEKSAI